MPKLIWNDPEPIEGNDYTINTVNGMKLNSYKEVYDSIADLDEDSILLITYNDGMSEAEVIPQEIVEV